MASAGNASQPEHPPPPRRTIRLGTVLMLLLVVALVPALTMAVSALWQSGKAHRDASAMRLADTTRTLAQTIEGDLANRAALLQAMALGIDGGGIALEQARRWVGGAGQGRLLISVATDAGIGQPPTVHSNELPAGVVRDALARDGVVLSNLFTQPGQPTPSVAMSVALRSDGPKHAVLSLLLPADHLIQLAPQRRGDDNSLLIAVTDGTGRLVARSRDADRFVGRPVPSWNRLQALNAPRGQFEAVTAEGGTTILTFETLATTPGWVVVIGEPAAVFAQSWQRPLAQLASGSALGLLAALAAALWIARSITRPAQALARNALAVARGAGDALPTSGKAPATDSVITEFESMRQSIEAAQTALHDRAEAERRNAQALATNELRFRTLAHTGAVVLWRATPNGGMLAMDGWQLLTGESDAQALGSRWRSRLHPEDRPVVDTLIETIAQGSRQIDAEFRVAGKDAKWVWVRMRGAAVPVPGGATEEWVGVLEDVSERHRAQARIVHMALHDALTGLPNRVEFHNRLEDAIRRAARGDHGAVLYIDLDRFKEVNDTLGHPVGDALLRAVTERLRTLVREHDSVARLGGDEFAIVQSRVQHPSDAAELATRVVHALSAPYELGDQRVSIGASVGIMLIADARLDAEHLLKYADMALYKAKQEGRGRHSFFEPEMDQRMQARRNIELELREALERHDFGVVYQPLMNPIERRVSGLAAALYWQHPERGQVPASEFAAILDELGLSGRMVEWTLRRVCEDMRRWPDCPKVAVDISAALPRHGAAVADWAADALQASGLAPARLELEVDERALLMHPNNAERALHACKTLGVRLTMASIGAGHSGLGYLRRFPFQKVKLERAMLGDDTPDVHNKALVRAMTLLCEELGIVLGADGIDTEAQFAALQPGQHMEVQGALFGRHRAVDDLASVFEER
jgi:diguanylate cyclase (GGDEF)-like protein/PAS domain S-box-containing protein